MKDVQRTRSQRWYPNKDREKAMESKIDALETVFHFVETVYLRFWKDDPDYNAAYKAPSRSNLREALTAMEQRKVAEDKKKDCMK